MAEHICLLTDQELDADPFPSDDWPCDPRPYLPEADWDLLTLEKESCVSEVVKASQNGYDVFFNLCDGACDEGRVGIEVVQTLEDLDVPFTGATSPTFEPSREAMKRVCRAWGVDTPAYVIARSDADVERAARTLRFPLFVKHPSSYASYGITPASRVKTRAQLVEQASIARRAFGAALIEEYIDGTECTVLVAERPDGGAPTVYQPIGYSFPEGESFKHYDLKWVTYDGLRAAPVDCPELDARLRDACSRFFQGMGGVGYGRCDLRVDREGRVYMLEINPNCGIYYPPDEPASADLCLQHDPAGHEGFTRQVVDAALARHRRSRRNWRVLPRPAGDYGIFATRRIRRAERIVVFEEKAHHLVTRGHVEATWDERRKGWFGRYAWPLTDEVWVMWSDDPEDWRPVNHSCDPNAWLDGLNLVARRAIAHGDEITMDYATFQDHRMTPFECACGASACRGVIRGEDHLQDFVARYGDHLSDHVRRVRREALVRVGA